jgi:hypothetical protein
MANTLDDLLTALPAPTGNLDQVEARLLFAIRAADAERSRLRGVIGTNLSVALAALVVGTAIGVVQSIHPSPRAENNVNLVLTEIPGGALVN